MEIVWDEPKRLANLDTRGLDFAELTPEFFDVAVVRPAKQDRFMALGWLDGRPVAVIFARLGREAVSVISLRMASVKERKLL